MSIQQRWLYFGLFVALVFMIGPGTGNAFGFSNTYTSTRGGLITSSADTLRAGIEHVRAGRYEQAISYLAPLYQRNITYTTPERGSVAYWLGHAHLEAGHPKRAVSIWRSCVWTLRAQGGAPGIRLADAYVRTVANRGIASEWGRAETVYLEMLGQLGKKNQEFSSEEVSERFIRHVRELAVLLPDRVQRRTGITVDPYTLDISIEPTSMAGETLVGWWRSQDPLPATNRNERLQEHLLRVDHARDRYASAGRLDDRGKIFIRLGKPHDTTQVRLSPAAEATPHLAGVRVRDNEFWTYPRVDQKAHFLFVSNGTGYELGDVDMLFPADVRTGLDRSFDATLSYLEGLQRVLSQLATYHEDFGLRSSEAVDATQAALNQAQFGIGPGQDPNVTQSPSVKARDLRRRNRRADQENASKRASQVPNSYSMIGDRTGDLAVRTRLARFLTGNGKTRVEVVWQVDPSMQQAPDGRDASLPRDVSTESGPPLTFSGVREGPNHEVEDRSRQRYSFTVGKDDSVRAYTYKTTVEDSSFHLAMQWDQYARKAGPDGTEGPLLRRYTERRDSLKTLSSDPETLEMSDLMTFTALEPPPVSAIQSGEITPSPIHQVRKGRPLLIGFEVYHLGSDSDGRTQYTVSYEIERQTDQGGFLGLFGGDEREQTATSTTYRGESRLEKEYILLDSEDLSEGTEGEVKVTVRVRDETTGQTVGRSMSFRPAPPADGAEESQD